MSSQGERRSTRGEPRSGDEVWALPKLLAKAESAENERRPEADVRDLARPGPKARRIHLQRGGVPFSTVNLGTLILIILRSSPSEYI